MSLAMPPIKNPLWTQIWKSLKNDDGYSKTVEISDAVRFEIVRRRLLGQDASVPVHHGKCCDIAQDWLVMMGRSFDFSTTDSSHAYAPAWLASRYQWGAVQWPISWCEAVKSEVIDCGLFAAFATLIFEAKGAEVFRGQIMIPQQESTQKHWLKKWAAIDKQIDWVGEGFVYHEVCAVVKEEGVVGVFDPTDGVWLDPNQIQGHGATSAIKIDSHRLFHWGDYIVGQNQWIVL